MCKKRSTNCFVSGGSLCKPVASASSSSLQTCQAWLRQHASWKLEQRKYDKATAPFAIKKNQIIDKQKQFKWKVPLATYFLMMAWFVSASATTADISVNDANSWCVALLTVFIPVSLHRQFGVRRQNWLLPYCYASIKAKCFQAGRRVCNQSGHPCMRRIVSYCKWPCRAWRRAGRALAFLVKSTLCSNEIWSLKEAREHMNRKVARLLPPRNPGAVTNAFLFRAWQQTQGNFLKRCQLEQLAKPFTMQFGLRNKMVRQQSQSQAIHMPSLEDVFIVRSKIAVCSISGICSGFFQLRAA